MRCRQNSFRVLPGIVMGAVLSFAVIASACAQETGNDGGNVLTREGVLRDPNVPVSGNPAGDLTIVEYFDYQCPYCKTIAPVIARVVKDDGKIRFVRKDWPIFGAASQYAARLVLAAKFQGQYEKAHDTLIGAKGKLTEDKVEELLAAAGVNVAKAKSDLQANKASIDAVMVRNNAQAEAFGFQGTPAFIIGTFRIPGVLEEAGFKQAIADARAAAAAPQ
jgi:protein-disulfide isomerase